MNTVLVVAEKPSVARAIVRSFSIAFKLKFSSTKGLTRYNRFFKATLQDSDDILISGEGKEDFSLSNGDEIIVTSVLGHILTYEFPPPFNKETSWQKTDPLVVVGLDPQLFPINEQLHNQLKEVGKKSNILSIGTDWDGHGESIGAQIARVVQETNADVEVGRMRFTSTGVKSIERAFTNQQNLDDAWVAQVDSLRRQDLRMGASVTRFLTVGVQERGMRGALISYGPCQSSVLWIITKRYLEREVFDPQQFWFLQALASFSEGDTSHEIKFLWKGGKKFQESEIDTVYNRIKTVSEGILKKLDMKEIPIKRPFPLDTDTLESEGSRFFRVSPKTIADIAEKLYNNGFITYPRTESQAYHQKDLSPLATKFLDHPTFGTIASECLSQGNPTNPSRGRYTKDHEPIRPAKAAKEAEIKSAIRGSSFQKHLGWRIYEYVVLRFLATIHKDGTRKEGILHLDVKGEEFESTRSMIIDPGFLSFYPYRRKREAIIPTWKVGDQIPIEIQKKSDFTSPPPLWTEAMLIREMARLNLGTDATRSTHISTVVSRGFVEIRTGSRSLEPTPLGLALYQVFERYAEELIVPEIRARVESLTQEIKAGKMTAEDVDREVIQITSRGLKKMKEHSNEVFSILSGGVEKSTGVGKEYGSCSKCESPITLQVSIKGKRFLACSQEECKTTFPLPKKGSLTLLSEKCKICGVFPLQAGSGSKAWNFCPKCWTELSTKDGPYFCSRCDRQDCPYSGGMDRETKQVRGSIGDCPDCGKNVVLTFKGTLTSVECESCGREWKAPNIRKGTTLKVNGSCKLCDSNTLQVKRQGKRPYNICVICSKFCFECPHKCYV